MNLFQVLSHGERVIVYSDEGSSSFYTWNQSLTLQRWQTPYVMTDEWEEVDIRTLANEPANFEAAKEEALRWHLDLDEGGLGRG